MSKVLPYRLFKSKKDYTRYKYKILNVLSNMASTVLKETLWNYTGNVNIAKEDRGRINAKSEFLYSRVVVTHAKKSYIGYMTRQEAVVFDKPKLDVKGVNFFKSTSTEQTADFIYNELLLGQIFNPKDGNVSLRRIYKTIMEFQARITEEISHGNIGYLKRSVKVKSRDAYTNPMRVNQYKAVYVWNYVNDDKDRIDLPATTTTAKVKLRSKKDVALLAPWPKIYERMLKLFDDPEIGDHEETKNGKTRMVKGKGINAIAIPTDYDDVPDWVVAIIDVETLVADNMALLTQLFKALGMSSGSATINGASARLYNNIVRI